MITYENLVKLYDSGKEKMDNGDVVNKLELMFMGYALDAVDTGRRNFNVELDFSEESIKEVEKILVRFHKTLEKAKPSADTILSFSKQFAGYIGQVIIQQWGGEWIDESNYPIENGPALRVKNQDLFILSKVHRRIKSGSQDNIYHFYQVIKFNIDGTSDITEVDIKQLAVNEKKSWIQKLFGR